MDATPYRQTARGIATVVAHCRKKYADEWNLIKQNARDQLDIYVTDDLNRRSVALAGAMKSIENDDEEAAMIMVASAYDPD
tara:strand:+ start:175 stop:417 length:243 start_codon:yes stop_codon:yes gene_type:complete